MKPAKVPNFDLGTMYAFHLPFKLGLLFPVTNKVRAAHLVRVDNDLLSTAIIRRLPNDSTCRHVRVSLTEQTSANLTQPLSKRLGLSVLKEVLSGLQETSSRDLGSLCFLRWF